MHLVGFIIKKFVTMHGHTNVRLALVDFFIISYARSLKEAVVFYIHVSVCTQNKRNLSIL